MPTLVVGYLPGFVTRVARSGHREMDDEGAMRGISIEKRLTGPRRVPCEDAATVL
jgi:hypothetical protein